MKERLQKTIASAGVTSRRKAEALIKEGRVTVNGKKVTELGTLTDPQKSRITVDGKLISGGNKKAYILLHKPRGYITSIEDPQGRPKVTDLLRNIPVKVFPVGRLDYIAEGVLLLTNDGHLAQRLAHPKFAVPRTYLVKAKGFPDATAIRRLRTGVSLPDGITLPARVTFLKKTYKNSWVRITVRQGKNRLIKRMFAAVGYPVLKLTRTKFGPFSLGTLEPGEYRMVSEKEVKKFLSP